MAGIHRHEPLQWNIHWRVEKYWGGVVPGARPYEVVEIDGNLLMYGGASALLHRLIGGSTVGPFDAANAHIGVGDGSVPVDATHNDLQGADILRKPMDAGFPQHVDGLVAGSAHAVFRATFAQEEANWAWNEWGIFNALAGGRMLNRKVETLGVKANAASWVLSATVSLA